MLRHGYAWHGPLPTPRYFFATLNLEHGTLNSERRSWLACGVIVLAALAAYHNSFSGPFVFDDLGSATENPTIRHFWPVWKTLSPPSDQTVGGRPLLNLTFALNYALGGENVWSYHAFNLLVHILAGLTLFGIIRRTLLRLSNCGQGALTLQSAQMRDGPTSLKLRRPGGIPPTTAIQLALTVALLWTLHPLQTESVTYIVQRAESLMGLFYLLTIYCFIRGADSRSQEPGVRSQEKESEPRGPIPDSGQPSPDSCLLTPVSWLVASLFFCLIGMATKEVMVSAPLMVLLYDRTFVAGTFREAWRQRRKFYLGLASTWVLLGYLVIATGSRGNSAGFGVNVAWWSYALTQFRAIVHYLQLSLWPNPLIFYYGTALATRPAEIVPYAVIVLLLVIGTAVALWRRPAIGFLGCWFFAILAPSSSIVPIATETMAEHRMYLALAPVVVLVVLGLYRLLGRRSTVIFLVLAAGLGFTTARRNQDYRSELSIWSDTVAKCPDNARAIYNLAYTFEKMPHRLAEAIAGYEAALRVNPDLAEAHNNLGALLLKEPGQLPEAMAQFQTALRIKPDYADAHYNLGNALCKVPGRLPDAIAEFETALRINPHAVETHVNLGAALLNTPGRLTDAIAQFQAALQLNPDLVEAHNDLGNALFNLPGRLPDAIAQYEAALRIDPDSVTAHFNLANALLKTPGRLPDAIAQLKEALRLEPDLVPAQELLNRLQKQTALR